METFKEILSLLGFENYLVPTITTFLLGLSSVYIFGRLLNIVVTPKGKNRVAIITIVCSSILFSTDVLNNWIPQSVKSSLFVIGCAVILYTLFGMRLFARVQGVQDVKVGDDGIAHDINEDTPVIVKKPVAKKKNKKEPPKKIPLMQS